MATRQVAVSSPRPSLYRCYRNDWLASRAKKQSRPTANATANAMDTACRQRPVGPGLNEQDALQGPQGPQGGWDVWITGSIRMNIGVGRLGRPASHAPALKTGEWEAMGGAERVLRRVWFRSSKRWGSKPFKRSGLRRVAANVLAT